VLGRNATEKKIHMVRYASNNYTCWLYDTPGYEADKKEFLEKPTAVSPGLWKNKNFRITATKVIFMFAPCINEN